MRITRIILTSILLAIPANAFQEKGWRGILPLHSTRADVERLLGPSTSPSGRVYKTENEVVFIEYAEAPCKGFLSGWNVPADTVLMITVRSEKEQRFSDLRNIGAGYVKTRAPDTPDVYYTDKDQGVRYEVSEMGIVRSVSYIPSIEDHKLRCDAFPAAPDLGHREIYPFDKYSGVPFIAEKIRLDNFAIQLQREPESSGYIIVYAGRLARADEAQARAERAKNYLVNVRNIESKRLITIDGGYQEESLVELYIVPRGAPAPTPKPTVAPSEAQIIKDDSMKSNPRSTRTRCK